MSPICFDQNYSNRHSPKIWPFGANVMCVGQFFNVLCILYELISSFLYSVHSNLSKTSKNVRKVMPTSPCLVLLAFRICDKALHNCEASIGFLYITYCRGLFSYMTYQGPHNIVYHISQQNITNIINLNNQQNFKCMYIIERERLSCVVTIAWYIIPGVRAVVVSEVEETTVSVRSTTADLNIFYLPKRKQDWAWLKCEKCLLHTLQSNIIITHAYKRLYMQSYT
jgi:hypothetical protein